MPSVRTAFVTGGSGFIGGALVRRLIAEGRRVRGLARSDAAAARLSEAGAEPVRGDLGDLEAIRAGAQGCDTAFHAAATVADWGPWGEFERTNVEGTRNALAACAAAGARRFLHVGTEAAVMAGKPLVMIDESAPLRAESKSYYCRSKAIAEQLVRDSNADGFETVVVRPRFVWGPGDATILPSLVEAMEQGRFAWLSGGRQRTSTTHVQNAVEGLLLGAERGRAGQAYFVTDGEPVVFRDFVTELVRTEGVEPPTRDLPGPLARVGAALCEGAWRALGLRGAPPLTRTAAWVSSLECTIDISKARAELGYRPLVAVEEGLAGLLEERGRSFHG